MFIPSKKAKFGIKIFCLVDPNTMYLVNSGVYLGKRNGAAEKNLGQTVVLNLESDFLSQGRHSVTDNFFTSAQFGIELWDQKTCLLGIIRKSRAGDPNDFIKELLEKVYSDFELHGIDEERLSSKTYQSITRRLQLEETNCALNDHSSSSHNLVGHANVPYLGNASQAVSSMGSMVEGAGAKVFALFK